MDNEELKNVKKKKEKKPLTFKNLIIRRIIFVIVFLIISIAITAYFISNTQSGKKGENFSQNSFDIDSTKKEARKHVAILDYDKDTFDYNSLKVFEFNEIYEGYDITYYQIDGLKNASIEDKINKNLKSDIESAITEAKNNGNIKGDFFVNGFVASNFGNTISIAYYLDSHNFDEISSEYTYNWEGNLAENYDLTTGNKIQIQDIFTNDTLGSDIFDSKFYSELVLSYTDQDFEENDWEYHITNYNDIEEKILELILDFNEGKDIPFYFDEQKVVLLEDYARIFYEDHLDFLALYNNFKTTNSIFTEKYSAIKNLPVLTKRFPSDFQVVEEGDNYYIDISLSDLYFNEDNTEQKETSERLSQTVRAYINDEVKNLKKEAIDSGKFIIYNYSYNINENSDWDYYNSESIPDGTYTISITKAKMETTKSLYHSEIKPRIQKAFRTTARIEGGEARLYNNQFYNYMYDEDYDYERMNEEWEINYNSELFMDKAGNIFETHEEALQSVIWGTQD